MISLMRATSQDELGGPEVLTCGIERVVETLDYEPRPVWTSAGAAPRQLAVFPVEASIPPAMTLAEWQHRKLAA